VSTAGILDSLSAHAHLAAALAPFVMALALRLLLGKNRLTTWLVSLSTMWFVINVLLTPYSPAIQREIESSWVHFR
jgi:hypothetical protein